VHARSHAPHVHMRFTFTHACTLRSPPSPAQPLRCRDPGTPPPLPAAAFIAPLPYTASSTTATSARNGPAPRGAPQPSTATFSTARVAPSLPPAAALVPTAATKHQDIFGARSPTSPGARRHQRPQPPAANPATAAGAAAPDHRVDSWRPPREAWDAFDSSRPNL
jgi:hypothetical protein